MTLLTDLALRSVAANLSAIFNSPPIDPGASLAAIDPNRYEQLREVTLAQWLLESARATSDLANAATNFSGLKWRDEMNPFATRLLITVPSEPIPVEFCKFVNIDAFILGYWKFLTRSPYSGLVDHTNTPANFIGFLQGQGFSTDPDYASKVVNLIPEARNLLAQARGIIIPPPPNEFKIVGFPTAVSVGQSFNIEGVAPLSSSGQNLAILIDGTFKPPAPQVGANGKWIINFVFNKPGIRSIKITLGSQSQAIQITVAPAPGAIGVNLVLTGSVGAGGVNKSSEVIAVKQRFDSLGYSWVGNLNDANRTTGFIQAIKLFQSIILGRSTVDEVDGRIDVGGYTYSWLQAKNAPVWQLMPDSDPAINFVNYERLQTDDNHDYGTSWLSDAILEIAKEYHRTNPHSAPFTINDVSIPHGGDTPDHHGHETGLMCDVNLPRTNGESGNITWMDDTFDRNAARSLIVAMRKHPLVRLVYFNDKILMREDLCDHADGHDNHIHFEIDPPIRQ